MSKKNKTMYEWLKKVEENQEEVLRQIKSAKKYYEFTECKKQRR